MTVVAVCSGQASQQGQFATKSQPSDPDGGDAGDEDGGDDRDGGVC